MRLGREPWYCTHPWRKNFLISFYLPPNLWIYTTREWVQGIFKPTGQWAQSLEQIDMLQKHVRTVLMLWWNLKHHKSVNEFSTSRSLWMTVINRDSSGISGHEWHYFWKRWGLWSRYNNKIKFYIESFLNFPMASLCNLYSFTSPSLVNTHWVLRYTCFRCSLLHVLSNSSTGTNFSDENLSHSHFPGLNNKIGKPGQDFL